MMSKYLRKLQKKQNARIKAAAASKADRGNSRGGGGYADRKHAEGIHTPGSSRLDKH
jgi:hypothetical protein